MHRSNARAAPGRTRCVFAASASERGGDLERPRRGAAAEVSTLHSTDEARRNTVAARAADRGAAMILAFTARPAIAVVLSPPRPRPRRRRPRRPRPPRSPRSPRSSAIATLTRALRIALLGRGSRSCASAEAGAAAGARCGCCCCCFGCCCGRPAAVLATAFAVRLAVLDVEDDRRDELPAPASHRAVDHACRACHRDPGSQRATLTCRDRHGRDRDGLARSRR